MREKCEFPLNLHNIFIILAAAADMTYKYWFSKKLGETFYVRLFLVHVYSPVSSLSRDL